MLDPTPPDQPGPGPSTPGPSSSGLSLPGRVDPGLRTSLEHRPDADAGVLTARGEVDALTAPDLDAALGELLAADHARLVVDLSGVTFLASSGLTALIRAAARADERGIRLQLVAGSRTIRRPLEITGVDQLFDLHTDLVGAIGGMKE